MLIVSPRFAPSNAADSHRVRLLLPHLRSAGVEAEVLAVDSRDVACPIDNWLASRLPADVPIHRVRAWQVSGWGLRGLAQRSFVPLLRAGSRLLEAKRFDVVLFSTTEFLLHALGPVWKSRYGVPFCMDYQDPWVNDYYRENKSAQPPGGRLKYGLVSRLHRIVERRVAPEVAGVLAVSQAYVDALDRRYGRRFTSIPRLIQPFPGEPSESEELSHEAAKAQSSTRGFTWRYVGIASQNMRKSLRIFFDGWRQAIDQGTQVASNARLEAFGTTYIPYPGVGFQSTLSPIASEYGLGAHVTESPARLGYRDMLEKLRDADGLVVFGSDDPSYTASKLYPYLLAAKPLLVICHEQSSIVGVMRVTGGGHCITFSSSVKDASAATALSRVAELFAQRPEALALNRGAFEPYTASAQARTLADWIRTDVVPSSVAA